MNDDNHQNRPPPTTPARLAAAATAAGVARMGKLRAALAAALRGALTSTDYEEFRACFPDFADDVTLALHDLYRQVLHAARAHSEAEFEEVCQEAGLLDALAAAEASALKLKSRGRALEGTDGDDDAEAEAERAARGARVAAKKGEAARLREALAALREEQRHLDEQLGARRGDAAAAARRFARVGGDLEPLAAAAATVVVD